MTRSHTTLSQLTRRAARVTSDAVLLLAIPFVLAAIFYTVPESTREAYAFHIMSPDAVTAYTSAYIHLTTEHLTVNVIGYAAAATLCYLFCWRTGTRNLFYAAFATFVFIAPALLTGLNLAFPRNGVLYGFSGVVFTFTGFLPVAASIFIDQRTNGDIPAHLLAPFVYLVGAAFAAYRTVTVAPVTTWIIAMVGGLVVLALAVYAHALITTVSVTDVRRHAYQFVLTGGQAEFMIGATVLFTGFLYTGFPGTIVLDGAVINTYIHFLGYAFGFLTTYTVWCCTPRTQPSVTDNSPLH